MFSRPFLTSPSEEKMSGYKEISKMRIFTFVFDLERISQSVSFLSLLNVKALKNYTESFKNGFF